MTRARDLAAFVSNADGDIKFDTDTLFIDSSANRVGIGTTTPDTSLHIESTAPILSLVDSNSFTDANDRAQIRASSDKMNFQWYDDSASTTTEIMAITNDGKVGIGTTTPDSVVDVEAAHSQLRLTDSDDSKFVLFSYSGGDLVTRNNSTNTTVNQFTLAEDGNFGVGTMTPIQKLSIFDDNSDIAMSNGPAGQFGIDGNGYGFAIALNSAGAQMYTNSSSRDLIFGVNETEVARITPQGIAFGGDDAAANSLDDYEEGTWTPNPTSGMSGLTVVRAAYVKVGKMVFIQCYVNSFTSTTSSQIVFSGLPFSSNASGYATSAFESGTSGNSGFARVRQNSQVVDFYSWNPTSLHRNNLTGSQIGGHIIFSLVYEAA